MSKHQDDSQMSRFEGPSTRTYGAWDAVRAVAIVALLLILFSGGSVGDATAEMDEGIGRDLITAVGEPTGWVADRLPLDEAQSELTAGLSPEAELGEGGFETAAAASEGAVPPVTPEAFDPAEIGAPAPEKRPLQTLLVTGDSLSTPLDTELARMLAPDGVDVIRDPHLATGISNSDLVDWGELATSQMAEHDPDAVVVFIGANEGFGLPAPGGGEVECCGTDYAAAYATRVRQVMDTFRQGGETKVYWLTVMTPRDPDAARIVKLVDAAIPVAAQPWRSDVRVIDTVEIFTPGGRYDDSIEVDGSETIVRESDGIHLNAAGSEIAANAVIERLGEDFTR
jgi:hypothetical protein